MENQAQEPKKVKKDVSAIRISSATQKLLSSALLKFNKKNFGKRIKADALIARALTKLDDADIKAVQEQSLSNADRLEMKYREHCKRFGAISKDEFFGILLAEQAQNSKSEKLSVASAEGA